MADTRRMALQQMIGQEFSQSAVPMSAMERLHSEVVELSGGELRRAVERVTEIIPGLDPGTAEQFAALIREVWGGAVICELDGLRLLLDEALGAIQDAESGSLSWDDLRRVFGEALSVIPGLLEYVVRSRRDNPCLLIPEITALRTLRRRPPVYEYQVLFGIEWPAFQVGVGNLAAVVAPDELKRILHLYQLGLVSVLKGANRAKGFEIMNRCAGRLAQLAEIQAEQHYWTALRLLLGDFADGTLVLRPDRTRLLAAVEKQLRGLAGMRAGSAGNLYPEGLWRAFIALLSLARKGRASEDWLPVLKLDFDDAELEAIRFKVFGKDDSPTIWPLDDLATRLVRLRNALDLAQEDELVPPRIVQGMEEDCSAVADGAHDLGLENLAIRFRRLAGLLRKASDEHRFLDGEDLQEYADSILYLDCAVVDFAGENPDRNALVAWSDRPLEQILQNSLLKTARGGVLAGAGAVLLEARGLLELLQDNMLADEGWAELETAFVALKGCAVMLEDADLATIFVRAWEFLQASRYHPRLGLNDSSRNLEYFADMVISLEIHLNAIHFATGEGRDALRMARECVSALKF